MRTEISPSIFLATGRQTCPIPEDLRGARSLYPSDMRSAASRFTRGHRSYVPQASVASRRLRDLSQPCRDISVEVGRSVVVLDAPLPFRTNEPSSTSLRTILGSFQDRRSEGRWGLSSVYGMRLTLSNAFRSGIRRSLRALRTAPITAPVSPAMDCVISQTVSSSATIKSERKEEKCPPPASPRSHVVPSSDNAETKAREKCADLSSRLPAISARRELRPTREPATRSMRVNSVVDEALSHFYGYNGHRVDRRRARELLEDAASAGDPRGLVNLGYCYTQGEGGLARDYSAAARCFAAAAAAEDPEGEVAYGECLFYGRGVDRDRKEAVRLF
eukprot:334994-Amorphochlora_amoeboformis.AAC.1